MALAAKLGVAMLVMTNVLAIRAEKSFLYMACLSEVRNLFKEVVKVFYFSAGRGEGVILPLLLSDPASPKRSEASITDR